MEMISKTLIRKEALKLSLIYRFSLHLKVQKQPLLSFPCMLKNTPLQQINLTEDWSCRLHKHSPREPEQVGARADC